jgi:AAA15 family ATPase/GTPase
VRSIKSLIWEIEDDQCPGWHVIIGDNGSGKSTFLKAISFVLVFEEIEKIRENWNQWLRKNSPVGRVFVDILHNEIIDEFSWNDKYFDKNFFIKKYNYDKNDKNIYLKYIKDITQEKNDYFIKIVDNTIFDKNKKNIFLVNHSESIYGASVFVYYFICVLDAIIQIVGEQKYNTYSDLFYLDYQAIVRSIHRGSFCSILFVYFCIS